MLGARWWCGSPPVDECSTGERLALCCRGLAVRKPCWLGRRMGMPVDPGPAPPPPSPPLVPPRIPPLAVPTAAPLDVCISPGPGSAESFRLRFMATFERWRSTARPVAAEALAVATGEPRVRPELVEERRELCCCCCCWFWIPALMVAAAAKDVERGDGEGGSPLLRLRECEAEGLVSEDIAVGSELRSGAMLRLQDKDGSV